MQHFQRELATWTRWLHIYLSMFSFAALLFFSLTGITLNHSHWIEGHQRVNVVNGHLLKFNPSDNDELSIVEYLRSTHHITAPLKDFVKEQDEYSVSFKGPGYTADGFIDRADGSYQITITESGVIAVMNDLHKGRDTGTVWAWLIDVAAVLMILVSLTGFAMIFFLKKKRLSGLLIAYLGGLLIWLIYSF